jgi:CheY-like chemotaxis protein
MREVTVLLVEDNAELLELLMLSLPALGPFRVFGAPDGVAGLMQFTELHPDCAIIDVRMPELSGYQLVRILRGDPETAATPLIILTALTQERDQFTGLASGADLFLTKPTLPSDLAQAIEQVMGRTSAEREDAYLSLVEQSVAMEVHDE